MEPLTLAIIVGLFAVLLIFGFWIGFILAGVSLFAYMFLMGGIQGNLPLLLWNGVNSYDLFALPLFIIMGNILMDSGVIPKLYDALTTFFNPIKGGLLYTNIAACAIFASVCGSSVATTAAIAKAAVPELTRRGYDKGISFGSLASAGPLGVTIPPSISYVTYGVIATQSIGRLFMAGIIPGILLAAALMLVILVLVLVRPGIAPIRGTFNIRAVPMSILKIMPIAVLMLIVLGSIYLGWATPTESGAIGVVGALLTLFIFRGSTRKQVWKGFIDGARITAIVAFLVATSRVFGYALAYSGITKQISDVLNALPGPPIAKIFELWVMLQVLGCFLDGGSIIVLTCPITVPFIIGLGFDPIWFGVLQVLNNDLASITPPVGYTLFTMQAMTGEKFGTIVKGCLPFYGAMLGCITLMTFVPQLVLWLPSRMFGS